MHKPPTLGIMIGIIVGVFTMRWWVPLLEHPALEHPVVLPIAISLCLLVPGISIWLFLRPFHDKGINKKLKEKEQAKRDKKREEDIWQTHYDI